MNRRNALRVLVTAPWLWVAGPTLAAANAPHIVFLNPGEPVERGAGPFWRMVAQYMAAAARDFGMQFEVLWAERDHLLMLRQCEELARRPAAPDYVILVNEKLTAAQMLKTLAASKAKLFVIHNDLTPEQRREIGNERQKIHNWIGTATTDAARGGYLLMEYLHRRLGGQEARVVGISGDPNTPVSRERAQGVEDYLNHGKHGHTLQIADGDWTYADGEQKAKLLLARYPETNAIWASNDSMALGAERAVKASGSPVLVGGMGGWGDALVSIAQGDLTATAAGDYMIGAWAIVMLNDYHRGRDFAAHGGVNQKLDYLYVVHRDNVARYDQAFFQHGDNLDFHPYSKAKHPGSGPYDFRLEHLVKRNAPKVV